jgi:hypothetical protein
MSRTRKAIAVAVATAAPFAAVVCTAPAASAAPSPQSSCVAQVVDANNAGPGQYQREAHWPGFGRQAVSFVASEPHDACSTAG